MSKEFKRALKFVGFFALGLFILVQGSIFALHAKYGTPTAAQIAAENASDAVAKQAAQAADDKQRAAQMAHYKAQELVKQQLRDPDSAEFGPQYWVASATGDSDVDYVCGTVNAKNGFGGYVGEQYYMAAVGSLHTGKVIIGPSPIIAKVWCEGMSLSAAASGDEQ
jgi:hypothetical protein